MFYCSPVCTLFLAVDKTFVFNINITGYSPHLGSFQCTDLLRDTPLRQLQGTINRVLSFPHLILLSYVWSSSLIYRLNIRSIIVNFSSREIFLFTRRLRYTPPVNRPFTQGSASECNMANIYWNFSLDIHTVPVHVSLLLWIYFLLFTALITSVQ